MTNAEVHTEQNTPAVQLDAECRSRIGKELRKNIMVEAAAGTGKTTCIIDRMVNLIATGTCEIEKLVAVTFTRKAAAELRERFQRELRKRQLSNQCASTDHDTKQRIAYASDNSNLAFVGTIHSFCASLLRERPVEFNVDPAFRELTDGEDDQLRAQAWYLNIDELSATNDDLLVRLKDFGLECNQLKECFDRFIEYRDIEDWPVGTIEDIDIPTVQRQAREYVTEIKGLIPLFPKERGTDTLMELYETLVRKSERAGRSLASFFEWLELFDTTKKAVQKCWHNKAVAKSESMRLATFRSDVVAPALQWWYRNRYEFVVVFLRRAVSVYERLKRSHHGLGFSDLLMYASRGLKANAALRGYFRNRYTHFLVDEFQDTDPIQAEMLLFLTGQDHHEQDWQKCSPLPGSLFLVGDPKQSIYRFRRGDIVTYNRVKEIFLKSGGELLKLAKNFRSGSDLIRWNNQVFESKFKQKATEYQAAAESMLQGRVECVAGELSGVRKLLVPTSNKQNDTTSDEADYIARFIRFAIDSGMTVPRSQRESDQGRTPQVQPRDFLIIPRNRTRIHIFKQALDRFEIPCQVDGSNAFEGIAELTLLTDCLRAVDDVQNPVHYLALLRDRLFGFSDAELYDFRQAGGKFSYYATVPLQLEPHLKKRFEDVNSRLRRYQSWLRAFPFAVAIDRIAEDLGLLASTAAASEGNIVAGGLLRAIESLRQQCLDFDSISDVVSYFENLSSLREVEGCTALPPDANVVRLMNLHKAKGLESPIVFLSDTTKPHSGAPHCHIDRTREPAVGYMGIDTPNGYFGTREVASPPNWTDHQQEEKLYLEAESDRLLYVATTRAACMLVLSVGSDNSNWSGLHAYVADAPAVHIPTESELSAWEQKKPVPAKSIDHLACRKSLEEKWSKSLTASYSVETAKHLGLQGTSRPKWEASGEYGYRWGSAVHELIEAAMKQQSDGSTLRPHALRLANEYKLGSHRVDELIATVHSVSKSNIWKRAVGSLRSFSELPFETSTKNNSGQTTIIRGVIDLIFEEPTGWVIVDYKTDDIQEADIPSAIGYYRGQLEQYAHHWRELTGYATGELGLYFTRIDRYVQVD